MMEIVARLPMELQMVMAHRVVGSAKELVLGVEVERAVKKIFGIPEWKTL